MKDDGVIWEEHEGKGAIENAENGKEGVGGERGKKKVEEDGRI